MSLSISNMNYSFPGNADLNQKPATPYEEKKLEERKEQLGIEDPLKKVLEKEKDKHSPDYECETCKNRKYQDGSDEMVSFKTAQHIAPSAAYTAVRAHEQEHVSNAYNKAFQNNAKVVEASVTIHTAICPECGRSYISGGTTHTQIKYYNEDSPYQKALKTQDASKYAGMNLDIAT